MPRKFEEEIRMQHEYAQLIQKCLKVMEIFNTDEDLSIRNWILGDLFYNFLNKWGKRARLGLTDNLAEALQMDSSIITQCVQFRETFKGFRKYEIPWSYFRYGLMLLENEEDREKFYKEIKEGKLRGYREIQKRRLELEKERENKKKERKITEFRTKKSKKRTNQ